ncbi:FdhF/YdeP family oxidoreductase [Maribacter sp. HTCC2170]|uniref:FdhF/YdeP family oxidoreductase n=1 Tax=Maribacter sp. (strain HTCC2170 / KCCM 42371) TaxID=313603 RepID=UPI00006BD4AA|nr:FdhF/YdeP family oxidoreductase [Maribacter sp. HTCC2170]EAR02421.1 oxidoreductase alpha (molybdopterin) subunit [Maribacter sp. HTCC2170]
MDTIFRRNVSVRGSDKFTNIKLTKPSQYAAGTLGIKVALQHGFKEMGIFRSMRAMLKMNQNDGFECPSCAWPDPDKPSKIGEFCENGAKALADESTTEKIGREFFKQHSVEEISQLTDFELNKFGRLTEPMVLRPGKIHYEPISWQESYNLVSAELKKMDSPNEAIFYTSGRSSNEAAFLYGMFARALGTNNMPDCSNMCHESSGVALLETLGIGKGSIKLEDLHGAEVVIVAGQNPGTNHPRMLSALEKCRENGGKVISVNPLEESGLVNFKNPQSIKGMFGGGQDLTNIHLPVRINMDIPLVKLILKKMAALDSVTADVFDHDFLNKFVDGYDDLINDIAGYDTQELLQMTGVNEGLVDEVVQLLASKSKVVVCWAMGLTQHKNSVATIREYINLLLLKGALGKPNAGTCPVRGHSNVQGDRSVGIMHHVNRGLNAKIEKHLGFTPPDKEGLDTVGSMKAMYDGLAKVFICLGGNFLMAASDTEYTAEAIMRCELTVQISTKLNRSHLVTGKTGLILPTFGRSEKDMKNGQLRYITLENSMGRVRQSRGLLKPISNQIKSEPELIAELADTYFEGDHTMDWKSMATDYELIRQKIDVVISGFEKTAEKSKGSGYYLPNNVRDLDFSMLPNGKAQLTINQLPNHVSEEDEFLLMTIRSHDQFNTTIYGLDDRYRGVYNERRVLFMNEEDMNALGLKKMDVVDITSNYDQTLRTAHKFLIIPYKIPKGNLAAYFPETNVLIPYNQYADKSKTPISKSVKVKIQKVQS